MTSAFVPNAGGATLLVRPTRPNTCRCGAIVNPTSAPYDWLGAFPNAECATNSTYPRGRCRRRSTGRLRLRAPAKHRRHAEQYDQP